MNDQKFDQLMQFLTDKFEQIDTRFAQIDARLDQFDERFAQIDARFEQVEARFEQIDGRFAQVDTKFEQVESNLLGELANAEARIKRELRQEILDLRVEMREGFDGVGEAIEASNEHFDEQHMALTARVQRLERKAFTH